jgi:hypothetical protein
MWLYRIVYQYRCTCNLYGGGHSLFCIPDIFIPQTRMEYCPEEAILCVCNLACFFPDFIRGQHITVWCDSLVAMVILHSGHGQDALIQIITCKFTFCRMPWIVTFISSIYILFQTIRPASAFCIFCEPPSSHFILPIHHDGSLPGLYGPSPILSTLCSALPHLSLPTLLTFLMASHILFLPGGFAPPDGYLGGRSKANSELARTGGIRLSN